ncbi:MAG: hypothetical protein ABSE86_30685 [Bryobacteraceae bacterium]
MTVQRLLSAAILLCAGSLAQADTLTILNPSFEANVLACSPGPGCATDDTLTDWTASTANPSGFSGGGVAFNNFGVYKPGTGQYPGGVPDGVNVAYLSTNVFNISISQVLGSDLKANDTYTLTGFVGIRKDTSVIPPGIGDFGYNVALDANGTVLTSLVNEGEVNAFLTPGTFVPFTVTFNSGSSPAQLGKALEIVLTDDGSGNQFEPSEMDFDKLSLTDTSQSGGGSTVPEPALGGVLAAAVLGICAIHRRRLITAACPVNLGVRAD